MEEMKTKILLTTMELKWKARGCISKLTSEHTVQQSGFVPLYYSFPSLFLSDFNTSVANDYGLMNEKLTELWPNLPKIDYS